MGCKGDCWTLQQGASFQGPGGSSSSYSHLTRALRDLYFHLLSISSSSPCFSLGSIPHSSIRNLCVGDRFLLLGRAFVMGRAQPPLCSAMVPTAHARSCSFSSMAGGGLGAQGCLADKLKGMFNSSRAFIEGELEQVFFAL